MSGLPWKRIVLALFLFGAAFGYLEAAVVSYLRVLHEPARLRYYPRRPAGELFPLLTLEQLQASGPVQTRTLAIEIGREAATLVMLAAIALAVAANARQWTAAFAIAFGTWDIAFYVFLKIMLDWPSSLLTWDILFLLPVPWVGPVLAPVLVSVAMIAAGVWQLRCESLHVPIRIGPAHWIGIFVGAGVVILAFAMDYRNIMAAGMPQSFHWGVFGVGMLIGVGGYAHAAWGRRREVAGLS